MAENVHENKPPEPPPEPAEVPKPTEQSNRARAKAQVQPIESQQSAYQDARNAAQSEHAKATGGRKPDNPPSPGDQGFDPGEHRGELRDDFRAGTHDPDGRFDEKERRIADRLADDGASVHPRERDDTVEDKKNPDSMVRNSPDDPGTITEFKTLDSASSNAVRRNILEAAKQVDQYGGGDAVLDGRGVNLSYDDARRGYARAVGQAKQMDLPMPDRVKIIMGDGSIKVFPEE